MGLTDGGYLPLHIVAKIHGNKQLVGQQGRFRRGGPNYQTQRHKESRHLLNEPGKLDINWKSIFAGSISSVWDIFEEQSNESAGCHENHGVSHTIQNVQFLLFRGEESGEESVHHDRNAKLTKMETM